MQTLLLGYVKLLAEKELNIVKLCGVEWNRTGRCNSRDPSHTVDIKGLHTPVKRPI